MNQIRMNKVISKQFASEKEFLHYVVATVSKKKHTCSVMEQLVSDLLFCVFKNKKHETYEKNICPKNTRHDGRTRSVWRCTRRWVLVDGGLR